MDSPCPGADSDNLDEEFIPKADSTKPIIVMRIRPEFLMLIDGNHRVAKERLLEAKELPAYYLTDWQHRQFFSFSEEDLKYVF